MAKKKNSVRAQFYDRAVQFFAQVNLAILTQNAIIKILNDSKERIQMIDEKLKEIRFDSNNNKRQKLLTAKGTLNTTISSLKIFKKEVAKIEEEYNFSYNELKQVIDTDTLKDATAVAAKFKLLVDNTSNIKNFIKTFADPPPEFLFKEVVEKVRIFYNNLIKRISKLEDEQKDKEYETYLKKRKIDEAPPPEPPRVPKKRKKKIPETPEEPNFEVDEPEPIIDTNVTQRKKKKKKKTKKPSYEDKKIRAIAAVAKYKVSLPDEYKRKGNPKQKRKEWYLKNRDKILKKAKERRQLCSRLIRMYNID